MPPRPATDTLIVGDTGGTTFDVSLVRGGRIPRTRETWLGQPLVSHMTGMPSVDVKSIGAGGGSIAWVDRGGLLHVGPISAGAVPGPVAYRRGGTRPTVTDAALVLGFLDADFFLGGTMTHAPRGAPRRRSRAEVAAPLGKPLEEAAIAVIELATENMVQAIMDITVNQGIDPAAAAFVAGGGAAGLNCGGDRPPARLPPGAGARDPAPRSPPPARSSPTSPPTTTRCSTPRAAISTASGVNAVLARLEAQLPRLRRCGRHVGDRFRIDWSTEARYPDQAWEIEVPLRGLAFRVARRRRRPARRFPPHPCRRSSR